MTIKDILPALARVIPIIKAVFPFDSMIAVSDTEEVVYYCPGNKMRFDDSVGHKIQKGDGLWEAVHDKEVYSSVISKEVCGFPFKSINTPIFDDDGTVIGALGLAYSLENQEALQDAAQTIAASSEEIIASSQELLANAERLHDKMKLIHEAVETAARNLDKSDQILTLIKDIANTTNILGLNASIEAARAGVHGRGFAVVSEEIRKLSNNSSASVKEIKESLEFIRAEIISISSRIAEAEDISVEQAKATEEITKAMVSLTTLAESIRDIAMKV